MMYKIVWFKYLIVVIVFSLVLPSRSETIEKLEGDNVTLSAVCFNKSNLNDFEWTVQKHNDANTLGYLQFNGTLITKDILDKSRNTSVAGVPVFYTIQSSDYSLVLLNVSRFLNNFTISCTEGASAHEKIWQLKILVPPTFVNITSTTDYLMEGQQGQLTCSTFDPDPRGNITFVLGSSAFQPLGGPAVSSSGVDQTFTGNVSRRDNGAKVQCHVTWVSSVKTVNVTSPEYVLNVTYPPDNTTVTSDPHTNIPANTNVTLTCSTTPSNPPPRAFTWLIPYHPTVTQTSPYETTPPHGGTLTTAYVTNYTNTTQASATYSLRIDEHLDGQTIRCSAHWMNRVLTESAYHIKLVYPPKVHIFGLTTLTSGQPLTLICNNTRSGSPEPIRYSWNFTSLGNSSTSWTDRGNELNFTSVSRSHSGVYRCTASNSVGYTTSQGHNVSVQYRPEIVGPVPVIVYTKSTSVMYTDTTSSGLTVTVSVRAFPTPLYVQWQAANGSVLQTQDTSMSASADDLYVLEYSLTDVKVTQMTVHVNNSIGDIQIEVHIRPTGPPDPPFNLTVTCTSTSALVLDLIPGSDGGAVQTLTLQRLVQGHWEDTQVKVTGPAPGAKVNMTLRQLQAGSELKVRVKATNVFNGSSETEAMDVTTPVQCSSSVVNSCAEECPTTKTSRSSTRIVAVVVTSLVLIICVVTAVVIYRSRREKRRRTDEFNLVHIRPRDQAEQRPLVTNPDVEYAVVNKHRRPPTDGSAYHDVPPPLPHTFSDDIYTNCLPPQVIYADLDLITKSDAVIRRDPPTVYSEIDFTRSAVQERKTHQ